MLCSVKLSDLLKLLHINGFNFNKSIRNFLFYLLSSECISDEEQIRNLIKDNMFQNSIENIFKKFIDSILKYNIVMFKQQELCKL